MNLSPLDIAVISIPLAVVLGVGLVLRRYLHGVADFLAAGRCAGRFLICTAAGETAVGLVTLVVALEVFSKAGLSLKFWDNSTGLLSLLLGLFGLVIYRFRETRALTFHQFFEMRYSKGIRVFSSFLNVFSGLLNFGVQPAVGARFFVYFLGMPPEFALLGWTMPTFIPVMLALMALSLLMTLMGGQISVMVTDCLEGLISMVFYLIVAVALLLTLSYSQMHDAMLSGAEGQSYINPFDIGGRADFDGWFILFGLALTLYTYRSYAWQQGFAAAARNAHESKMAGILSSWRGFGSSAMLTMISIGAFTVLHHPDFAAQAQQVKEGLAGIGNPQIETQMSMPMALGLLLAPGIKGCFCAIGLFGLLASQATMLHGYGSTIMQDVILPGRKKLLTPESHVRLLKLSVCGVAVFACAFSVIFKPVDYLMMLMKLIGAIYLGGVGVVVWGGLYWKRGTWQAAWAAMGTGAFLAITLNLIQMLWTNLHPAMMTLPLPAGVLRFLGEHADKSPVNGFQLSFAIAVICAILYIVVSLLTSREPFNMDAMLHRGKYRVENEPEGSGAPKGFSVSRIVGIEPGYTRGDKFLAWATFGWSLFWQCVSVGLILWACFVARPSGEWWFRYSMVVYVYINLAVAVVTTVWFIWGVSRDLRQLFADLSKEKPDASDDGTVR